MTSALRPLCLVIGLLLVAMSSPLYAESGLEATLPLPQPPLPPGKKAKVNPRALKVKVDTTWVECNGYRPVRITVTPTPALSVDRTITVRMEPHDWTGRSRMVMTQDVELPAKAASAQMVMAIPQLESWQTFNVSVFDDGVPVQELAVQNYPFALNNYGNLWGDGASPCVLLLGDQPKDAISMFNPFGRLRESSVTVGLKPATAGSPQVVPGAVAGKFAGVAGIPTHDDLPKRWIDYSGLDIVYVELPELVEFIKQYPQQWKAIRQWLLLGGNLWVGGCGKQFHRIDQLEELLEMPSGKQSGQGNPPGWSAPDEKKRNQPLQGLGQNYGVVEAADDFTQRPAETVLFRMRSLGQGQVVAFGDDDPLTQIQKPESWTWIFNSVTPQRWNWAQRHGISLQRANPDFWEFLIPGVGLAPVTEFQVLITVFVLCIGPLNYFLLRRWNKLNLLVITVPLSALAVTGTLLLYALVADGLGVRVRGRSYTEIDQRRGEATSWARLSYYAGLRPSQGLSFPTDTAVYPISHESEGAYYGSSVVQRAIDWGDTQDLGAGWLNARTPTQLLTVSSRPAQHRLQIRETGGAPPTVENLLNTQIRQLMLIDSRGAAFWGNDIAAGKSVQLKPSTVNQNAAALRQTYDLHRPQRPAAMTGRDYGFLGIRRRYSFYNYYGSHSMDEPSMRSSILERSLAGLGDPNDPRLSQPRTYVAVVERSPEVSFGLPSGDEEAGYHVIVGRW